VKTALRPLLGPVSPRRLLRGAALFLALAGAELAALALLAPVLDLAGLLGQGELQHLAPVLPAWRPSTPAVPIAVWLLATIAVALLRRQQQLYTARLREETCRAWQLTLHDAIQAADWAWVGHRRHADLQQAFVHEAARASDALSALASGAVQLTLLVLHLALAAWLAPELTLCAAVAGGGLVLLLRPLRRRAWQSGARLTAAAREVQRGLSDLLGAGRTIRAHGEGPRARARAEELTHEASAARLGAIEAGVDASLALDVGAALGLAGLLVVALQAFAAPPGVLLLLLVIYTRVLRRAGALHATALTAVACAPAARSLQDLLVELRARAVAPAFAPPAGALPLLRELRVDDVSFGYPARAEPVLDHVDLTVHAGKLLVLEGPSGAGKTTLADLLLGLLTPTRGRITIDGIPLSAEVLPAWRRRVAYVPQDPHLLPGSVRENLAWARPEASEQDMLRALRTACMDEVVARLPDGLDTPIGERGAALSGGGRQRLSLACALLREPAFLVLDEATSGLDPDTEARVLAAILARPGLTVLAITHRRSPALADARVVRLLDLTTSRAPELVGAP
jgi:ATP-binding cassette subfamily C protein